MLTKKLYFEGGGEPLFYFDKIKKKYFYFYEILIETIFYFHMFFYILYQTIKLKF